MSDWRIVTRPAYRAVGMKWEGTFQEVPELKKVIHQMRQRVDELEHAVNRDVLLGLSYHVVENGFAHYSVFEVTDDQKVLDGMVEIQVPEWTYMYTKHKKGENVVQTYNNLHQWLHDSEYQALKEAGVTYYDPYLPIKHEYYPTDQDPDDPHFDILIPVVKES
ncbi:GyrI-like domain-containing protein [Piscibacillus halophilus]|uniref:GyrI-like domain-containing protein n=1 Tax=Piscibacillus halophilus TaxID=571933 RepID=UPI002409759D|nr:GyrI-like domain-containing protein [Piscibacillus halophilus]